MPLRTKFGRSLKSTFPVRTRTFPKITLARHYSNRFRQFTTIDKQQSEELSALSNVGWRVDASLTLYFLTEGSFVCCFSLYHNH